MHCLANTLRSFRAGTQFCQNILTNGFGTFLPAILSAMGHDRLAANYLTIPVYILGAIAFFTFAYFSDKYQKCASVRLTPPHIVFYATFVLHFYVPS